GEIAADSGGPRAPLTLMRAGTVISYRLSRWHRTGSSHERRVRDPRRADRPEAAAPDGDRALGRDPAARGGGRPALRQPGPPVGRRSRPDRRPGAGAQPDGGALL